MLKQIMIASLTHGALPRPAKRSYSTKRQFLSAFIFGNCSWLHDAIDIIVLFGFDAVFIKQFDIDERNRQVSMMGETYRKADNVIV